MAKPISVKKLAGKRFKTAVDEAWKHERPEIREPDKRWYELVPCKCGGEIRLYSESPAILKFYTPSKRKTCREIFAAHANESGWKLDCVFAGDAADLWFPVACFEEVALAVGAYKRRQVSEETKERLRAMGAKHLWKSGQKGGQTSPQE